jgi:hypothetical protein
MGGINLTCAIRLQGLVLNPSQPNCHCMYHLVQHSKILCSAHTVYLCVLCGSQNKQRLLPYKALTISFCNQTQCLLRQNIIQIELTLRWAVAWLRQLVVGLSQRRPGFDPRPDHVTSVVDKITLGHVFLRVLRFSPFNITPQMIHVHLHPTRRTNGQSVGTFQKAMFFRKLENIAEKST